MHRLLQSQRSTRCGLLLGFCLFSGSVTVSAQSTAGVVHRLEIDLRIGTQPGTAYEFGSLRYGFALAPDGGVLVPDNEIPNVRHFDSTGRVVQVIGRRGSGPGEFQSVRSVGFWADTIWVVDRVSRRVTLFPPKRNVITIPVVGIPPKATLVGVLPSRAFVFLPILSAQQLLLQSRAGFLTIQGSTATIPTFQRELGVGSIVLALESGGGQGTVRRERLEQAFSQDGLVAISPNGKHVAVVDRRVNAARTPLMIEILDERGRKTTSFTVDREPVRVNPAFVSAQLDTIANHIQKFRPGEFKSQSAAKAFVAGQLKLPGTYPEPGGLIVEDDQTVWIAEPLRDRTVPELGPTTRTNDQILWTAYDGRGQVKQVVSIPLSVTLVAVRAGNFWGSAVDASGVPVVVRLRKR